MSESSLAAMRVLLADLSPGGSDLSCRVRASALAEALGEHADAGLKALSRITKAARDLPELRRAASPLIEATTLSADPGSALAGLASLAEASRECATAWPAPDQAQALVNVLAGGPFLTALLVAHPHLVPWLIEAAMHPWGRSALREDVAAAIEDSSPPGVWSIIRRWHQRHLLRLGWSDLAGSLDIADVARGLAALADVTIEAVATIHADAMAERFGTPIQSDGQPATWCIIGLGKLGGDELNFRSDVDVMVVFSDDGSSHGGSSDGIVLREWFSRWAGRLVDTLTEVSPDGMLYRVDTRLRPDGKSGALARPVSSYVYYYETRGEVWERQMLIKARPIGGDHALGERLFDLLEPFVFPRTLDLSPREEIRRVKSRIIAHLAARDTGASSPQTERNLKLRQGGLRDIEFIVQCLQLVVGGADQRIRSGNTLEALAQMAERRVLSDQEESALTRAYRLYRRIEHRLQMATGYATFDLPDGDEARTVLARQLGCGDTESFLGDLARARNDVIGIYDDVLGPPGAPDEIQVLLELPAGAEQAMALLAPYGFRDPPAAHRNLHHLAFGHDEARAPAGPRPAVVRLAPLLLEQLGRIADPDKGLMNLEQVLVALGAVESFSDLLSAHPRLLELLVTLCSGSQSLTDTLLRDPALIDWMLYSGLLTARRRTAEIGLVLRAGVAGLSEPDHIYRAVHTFRKHETLRVGLAYLLKLADDEETGCQLSAAADATVRQLYLSACAETYAQRGQPLDESGRPAGLVVLAMGKLGSRDMNFGSDLDLVFVHQAEGITTNGTPNVLVFSTVAQKIVRDLSQVTRYGVLYEVDTRLRPEGKSGPLTISLSGYRRYLESRASVWERQALTRARLIAHPKAGPEHDDCGRALMETIDAYVYGPCDVGVVDEVASMRERMEQESARKDPGRVNVKTGPGGLVDAEFAAQLGQIIYGKDDTTLRGADTLAVLRRLGSIGRLPEQVVAHLAAGYRHLRSLQMVLRINDAQARNVLPTEDPAATILAEEVGLASASELHEAVHETMERMRVAYVAAVGAYRAAVQRCVI